MYCGQKAAARPFSNQMMMKKKEGTAMHIVAGSKHVMVVVYLSVTLAGPPSSLPLPLLTPTTVHHHAPPLQLPAFWCLHTYSSLYPSL